MLHGFITGGIQSSVGVLVRLLVVTRRRRGSRAAVNTTVLATLHHITAAGRLQVYSGTPSRSRVWTPPAPGPGGPCKGQGNAVGLHLHAMRIYICGWRAEAQEAEAQLGCFHRGGALAGSMRLLQPQLTT